MEKLKCTSCNGQLDLDENGKPISCHVGDLINE